MSLKVFGAPGGRFGAPGGTFGDLGGTPNPSLHDLLTGSHRAAVVVEVWDPVNFLGYLVNPRDPTLAARVIDGSVDADSTAPTRRRLTMSVEDGDGTLTADTADAWLTPYGHEVRVYRGGWMPDGTIVAAALGVFEIETAEADDDGSKVTVRVDGFDRSFGIAARGWTKPKVIPAGTNVSDAAAMVILAARPDWSPTYPGFNFAPTDHATPNITFGLDGNSDPWKDAVGLAATAGMELFFDGAGIPTMRPVPTVAGRSPSTLLVEGEGSALVEVTKATSREGKENHVIVVAEGSSLDAPLTAEASDVNPRSKTFVGGTYGDIPVTLRSPLVTTQEQAQAMADAELAKRLGASDQVQVTCLVDPEREPGDVALVRRGRVSVNDLYLLDQISVPLAVSGLMGATGRRQAQA